jgi:hypothetical protein
MPILALNQFGQIYETSPDTEDMTGYGRSPHSVDQQDLTLGNAYLKSQAVRRNAQIGRQQAQEIQDTVDAYNRAVKARRKMEQRLMEEREAEVMSNPALKQQVLKQAVMQGCKCEETRPLTGNVFSANGMSGWAGMTRDQQAIHHVLSGMGNNVAHALDPMEARQAQMRDYANHVMRSKAR